MTEIDSPCFIEADWPLAGKVSACTTTRVGGVSKTPYDSFNLAAHVDDSVEAVVNNRRMLREELDLPADPVWLEQVHGNAVVDAASVKDIPQADASFTTQPGVVCAVLTADCLPVLFSTRDGGAVAAAHAGWRGLAEGVLEVTVQKLVSAAGVEAADVVAWLGPAIGPDAFEVGSEVVKAFTDIGTELDTAFEAGRKGHWQADLYSLARGLLNRCGVSEIYGGGRCTFSEQELFYSYRREQKTGRMATLIYIK